MSNPQETKASSPALDEVVVQFRDYDDFRQHVDKFSGQVQLQETEYNAAVKALQVQKRVETYITLGQALAMCKVLAAEANQHFLVQLFSDRGIAWAKDEQNKFLPFCKLLFGHYDENGKFVVDPSALAYAPVLRYMHEHNVDPASVPQYIEKFSGTYGKKLSGIRKQDQHDHRDGTNANAEQAALDLVLAEPAWAEFPVEPEKLLGEATKGKLIAMWGEWNGNRFIPRGFINSTSDQVEKLARKQAVANEPELRRRDLARKEARIVELEAALQAKASK